MKPDAEALETTHRDNGRVGERTHITLCQLGAVETSRLAHMPGVRGEVPGEHRNKHGAVWDEFLADIAANGIIEPIFVTVDYDQDPQISEGNHRRDAAVALGMTHVPVEVRYFGCAEQQGTLTERVAPCATLPSSPDQRTSP